MVDHTKVDFNQIPKKFCDGAIGAHAKDLFVFCMTSGNNLDSFATNPRVMKDIANFFARQVEVYEKQYGTIDMTQAFIPSPIQSSDLNNK
ncbi:MAG: hypothetical protein MUD00_03610 [Candidatus Pacebacteria bacterium]|jgi:hypothetical protein|nr:hypothetical protein [Candidatus Paceibacterota bacterium]